MKKFLCIMLSFMLLILCSCGKESNNTDNTEIASELNSAVTAANTENRILGEYMLEITFGDGAVLYYALGDVAWDRAEQQATAIFSQTYLGSSSEMQNYFAAGKMTSISNGQTIESERDSHELFSKFPYFSLLEYTDGCGNISVGSNTAGKTFTYTVPDTKPLCDNIVGGDIYELVTVIKKPQAEKTQYGETKCIYTVSDGRLISGRYEFDIKLFDTPSYIPGYSQPESEYTLDLHVTAKITYSDFGDSVKLFEIPEE